jgi:hypothetical protein
MKIDFPTRHKNVLLTVTVFGASVADPSFGESVTPSS